MFSKILSSVVKSDSSTGSAEAPGVKPNPNKIALVTKDSMSPSRQIHRTEKQKYVDPDEKAPACDVALSSQGQSSSDEKQQKWPIFNGEFEIVENLGSGNTAKVYLGRSIKDPS